MSASSTLSHQQTHQRRQHGSHKTAAAYPQHNFVSAFHEDVEEHNDTFAASTASVYEQQYHNQHQQLGGSCAPHTTSPTNYNNNAGAMGLRAASVVSNEGTPAAHEYQPRCSCGDCQSLLHNYTVETVLAAYVTQHLAYEARLQQTYGFVPAIGGPHGNVAVRLDPASGQRVEGAAPETSNAVFFHNHNHTMRPVPRDIRERSTKRFYEASATTAASPSTAATVAPAAPRRTSAFAHQHQPQQQQQQQQYHAAGGVAASYNYQQHQQQVQPIHQHQHYAAAAQQQYYGQ